MCERRRKQAHLSELEQQVAQLRFENSSLLKQLTDVSQKYNEAALDNRVLKAEVETLRAKIYKRRPKKKTHSEPVHPTVKRVTGVGARILMNPQCSGMVWSPEISHAEENSNTQNQHFVLEENMLEVDCPCVTPEVVLKASGHVHKFTDLMVKDEKTGTCYLADHLFKDFCKEKLEKDLSLTAEKAAEPKHVLAILDDLSSEQLGAKLKELSRNQRTVNQAYGGFLSGSAVRERIIRAFLVEEQKIVKKVLKIQKAKEKQAAKS
ncbi:hypothetical protein AAC387_Pa07g3621 [Persea americana]